MIWNCWAPESGPKWHSSGIYMSPCSIMSSLMHRGWVTDLDWLQSFIEQRIWAMKESYILQRTGLISGMYFVDKCTCIYRVWVSNAPSWTNGVIQDFNSLTTEKQMTKFSSANFQKMISPWYIILRIQRLKGKQCRSRWGGSLWATSSRSTLFANSAIFVTGS